MNVSGAGVSNGLQVDVAPASDRAWYEKVSDAAGLAGTNSSYQATPVSSYVNSKTQGGARTATGGHQPQGDTSSLDQSGYDQAQWEFDRQMDLLVAQREYNSAEAQKNRVFQERMSNTAYQRAVEDLEKAGLNKWLAVTGGANGASASTPSGSSATSSAGDASAPNPILYREIIKLISALSSSAIKVVGNVVSSAVS